MTNKLNFSRVTGLLLFLALGYIIGKYLYLKPSQVNGDMAPTFSGQLLNGNDFQLSDLKGKFVLIDFWGSWCGPCRKENPKLVSFYKKYNPAQFKDGANLEVVSVAIETEKRVRAWKKAIQKDGLVWPYHVFDEATSLRFFDSKIAGLYGVKEVPAKFLINPDGAIIGVNLSFEEMEKLLDKRLALN